ncbi:nodulation protein NodH [Pseudogemmobacter lacusdianii]|nr:nodulation protein NodH [Xinfangfangia sp. CPCC 101601]
MARFTSFVLFAEMRTGSNFLEANLNALPGLSCLGEVFNPHFIGKKDQTEMFGVDLAARERDPFALLAALRAKTEGMAGFRYFHDHDARVLPALLDDPACAKIILTRNPVDSYVSWKIAQATGQWKLTNAKNLKTAQADFDAAEFRAHLEALQGFQLQLMHGLQTRGQTAFYIDYDDIQDVAVLNGLAAWLGLEARLEGLDDKLKKQNPEEIGEKVTNLPEMEAALARLDRFNLNRTPNFEPRRPPAIPSFVAAGGLLFQPIRSGPEAQVKAWLLAHGPLEGDFVQKSLRQWKRAHPGHRSFTVIRHPLLRAHQAFLSQIVSGKLSEHRQALIRGQGADLPPPGKPFADLDQHRAAFAAFLRYAKLSVAGQMGQRVSPHWASQSAVLQGFAGFQTPDLVLREDQLAEGLAFAAAEAGLTALAPPAADRAAHDALAAIWLPDLEEAAREAYPRDYMGFGFGPWRDAR